MSVFISYSHVDSSVADDIASALDSLDVKYFRDVKEINWGDSITSTVKQGLEDASAIIVIVSPASHKSQWVSFEIGFGTGTGKQILPYLTHPSLELPGFISDLSYIKSLDGIKQYFEQGEKRIDTPQNVVPAHNREHIFSDLQIDFLMTFGKPANNGLVDSVAIDNATGRDAAQYQDAISVFQQLDLVQYSDGGYKLTSRGWELCDQFWSLKIADALVPQEWVIDSGVATEVGLNDGHADLEELNRHIDLMKQRGYVNTTRTSDGTIIQLTSQGATYRKRRSISI